MFCEIGPAAACVTDYPEHIAPRSPQKLRPGRGVLSKQIFNQHFKLAQWLPSRHKNTDLGAIGFRKTAS